MLLSGSTLETTGNAWKQLAQNNRAAIDDALVGVKREAVADIANISPGQLSKMLNGEINKLTIILGSLGLSVVPVDYIRSMERVLKEKL